MSETLRPPSATGAYDAVVVGAGANGLVASTRLARTGLRVLLLDRAETIGGQSAVIEFAPGFRAAPLGLEEDGVRFRIALPVG